MRYVPRAPREGINVSHEHPLREVATLVAGLVGLVLVAGVAIALSVDLAVRLIPPELESRSFAALAPDPESERDPRREALQALVNRLASGWPEAPYRFSVQLLDRPQVNAAALPGGVVLVTTGLLAAVASENELAFVLSHELGHFSGRHHLRRLGRRAVYGLALAALGLGGGGSAADLGGLAGELTSRGFDRDQEREADAFGLSLLVGEYGHAGGAGDLFEHLEGSGGAEAMVAYFSTHPAERDRVEALERECAERGWETRTSLRALEGALAR